MSSDVTISSEECRYRVGVLKDIIPVRRRYFFFHTLIAFGMLALGVGIIVYAQLTSKEHGGIQDYMFKSIGSLVSAFPAYSVYKLFGLRLKIIHTRHMTRYFSSLLRREEDEFKIPSQIDESYRLTCIAPLEK